MMLGDERTDTFSRTLYAGDGMRLVGIGPDAYTDLLGDTLPFKALVQADKLLPGDAFLALADRLWVLPDVLDTAAALPDALLYELVDIIKRGGKVGLTAQDDVVCDHIRDAGDGAARASRAGIRGKGDNLALPFYRRSPRIKLGSPYDGLPAASDLRRHRRLDGRR